ncbi:MAG: hypothetical protein IVW53_12575 [Chloroflexi bacterium]|nr:hypothetical protein [Chloroflexota bacterium]
MSIAGVPPDRIPCGRWTLIVGPDGTGKSTLAASLMTDAAPLGSVRYHQRFGVLPRSATSRIAPADPHLARPYGRWLSAAKVVYLYVDFVVGWLVRVLPARRRGGWVVMERGWADLAVDPRRYRLDRVDRLVRILGRLAPRPDVILLLDVGAEIAHDRQGELSVTEIERQRQAWLTLLRDDPRARIIDAGLTAAVVARQAREAISGATSAAGSSAPGPDGESRSRWVNLPPGSTARWVIQASSGRVAAAGLSVYQPVTLRGLIGWMGARVIARTGALALLPATGSPVEAIRLDGAIPSGSLVAVSRGTTAGRAVALILDSRGRAHAVAKLRSDPEGMAGLAHEAHALERARPHLPPGLAAPRLLAEAPGYLVFEAIDWRLRPRPWRLPPQVAADLGTFYLHAGGGPDGGPAHGDFSPWNLLRTRSGWMLIDWADAIEAAPPFADLIHFVVQSHALLGRPSTAAVVAGFDGQGWVGAALRAHAAAAALDYRDARSRLIAYLEASLPEMDAGSDDGRRGARGRQRLLAALAKSAVGT